MCQHSVVFGLLVFLVLGSQAQGYQDRNGYRSSGSPGSNGNPGEIEVPRLSEPCLVFNNKADAERFLADYALSPSGDGTPDIIGVHHSLVGPGGRRGSGSRGLRGPPDFPGAGRRGGRQ